MKATTSKAFRSRYLNTYQLQDFDNFEEFFLYLHLNRDVQALHVVGFVIGSLLFPWALFSLLQLNPLPLVVCNIFFYGMGFVSHKIGDGNVSRTATWPWLAFWHATLLNIRFLAGTLKNYEAAFMQKYPHTLWVYLSERPQPEILAASSLKQPEVAL